MGVISAVGVLTAGNWAGSKPGDYDGANLDKALKAWEAIAGKSVTFAKDLFPSAPHCKVDALKTCATNLKSTIATLDKGKVMVNQYITALNAVQAACSIVCTDMSKLSKGKDVDETKKASYEAAAGAASSISGAAAGALKNYQ